MDIADGVVKEKKTIKQSTLFQQTLVWRATYPICLSNKCIASSSNFSLSLSLSHNLPHYVACPYLKAFFLTLLHMLFQ